MRILLNPVFLLCLGIFLSEQLLEYMGYFIPFVHAYIDDVCSLPVLLTLASAAMSLVYYGKQSRFFTYRLSLFQVFFALVYCAILFEIILPRYSAKYVSDYWDILAYCLGAILYYKFINPGKHTYTR